MRCPEGGEHDWWTADERHTPRGIIYVIRCSKCKTEYDSDKPVN